MLPHAGTPPALSEQQPLLPRAPDAPVLTRCVLFLSTRDLHTIFFLLFVVHLARVGQLEVWAESVLVTLMADAFWLSGSLMGGLIMVLPLIGARLEDFQAFWCSYACFTTAGLALLWHSLLRICALHGLATRCLFPRICHHSKDDVGTPDLSGFFPGLVLSWTWAPVGVFFAAAGTLWRPWHLILYALPFAAVGQGPLHEMPWWQWREALVGSVFWACVLVVALAARSRAFLAAELADRRFLLMVGMAAGLFCTLLAFYMTVAPLVSLWLFLLSPWREVVHALLKRSMPVLAAEEWLAVVAMLWALGRVLYIAASAHLEQWSARQRMEETLRGALAHPFRAELEQGFGLMDGESRRIPRALSRLGSGLTSQEPLSALKEKHKALIAARRQLLLRQAGSQAVLPSHLRLTICRESILEDTWSSLFDRRVSELLAPRVFVVFEGEKGVDGGGLTRDWFDAVGRALAEQAQDAQGQSLLATAPDQALIPRHVGSDYGDVPLEQADKFRALLALGRFMALAVFHEHPLPVSFSLILCKYILRVPVGMGDVRQLDPAFFSGRVGQVLKENGLAEVEAALGEPLTFLSAATEFCAEPQELKPGGAQIAVTEENKTEYVQLLCEAYLCGGIRREIQCLLQGFWDVLPPEVLLESKLCARELSVLMSGVATLDPGEWRKHSDGEDSQVHTWFWDLVREMDQVQRCMLLHFATGSSRLPPAGFAELRPRFQVCVSHSGSPQHLPHAHTCANQIVLHRYTSKEQLRSKLAHALLTEDFGFS